MTDSAGGKPRKKLWGVWLHNTTDRRDDEWLGVMARNETEAIGNAKYNGYRFSLGRAMPAKDFCKYYGIPRSFLRRP